MRTSHAPSRSRYSAAWKGAVAALALVLVLAACGDDDDAASGTSSGTDGGAGAGELDCPTPASGEPVKIGFVWPEGATVAVPEVEEAARAAVEYGNDCLGGIGGRPIELVGCAIDEANQATATDCASRAVEGSVDAFVVAVTSTGEAMVPTITGAGIPYVAYAPVTPSEHIDQTGLVFAIGGGAAATVGAMAQQAKDEGHDKVGMLVQEVGAATIQALAAIPFGAAGVEVEIISVPNATADATPQLSAALSNGADVTTILGDATLCISYLQAAQAIDPDGEHWILSTCTEPAVVQAAGEDSVNGATNFGGYSTGTDPESQLYQQVMATYAPDASTGGFATVGYGSILSLIRGTTGLTGDVTRQSIAAALGSTRDVTMPVLYGGTFGCAEDPIPLLTAVCSAESVVTTYQDGDFLDPKLIDASALFGGGA